MNITLIAALIAAAASLVSVVLQIFNARKTEANRFHSVTHSRLIEERKKLQDLEYPEALKDVPFIINDVKEWEFYGRHLDKFVRITDEHSKFVRPILDAFDADIREVIDEWLGEFENDFYKYRQTDLRKDEKDKSMLENERELACHCHVLVGAIREGMQTQIDRLSDNLSSRKRRDEIHDDFRDTFYISPTVRRVFNPEWRDWP